MDCNLTTLFLQLWYSKQVEEGNAPGDPLGFGRYGGLEPIKVVGGEGGGDNDGNSEDSDLESRFSG